MTSTQSHKSSQFGERLSNFLHVVVALLLGACALVAAMHVAILLA